LGPEAPAGPPGEHHRAVCLSGLALGEVFEAVEVERDVDDIVHVDIPLASLAAFHKGRPDEGWRPLPPDWP
jgi:hypothetical protein